MDFKTSHIPTRYVMAFMAFLGYINIFLVRNSINLAIVAMVNYTAVNYNVPIIDNTTKPGLMQCGVHSENFTGKNEDGPFVWSQPIQALISTSFLWGYITTNIPGGRLAEVVGTKYLLTGSMLLTSVLTVLVPPAAYLGWQYLVFIRVLMGIALGPSFPSMHPMIAKWIPPNERSTISALVYGGAELGTVSGLLLTGLIIENIGWEAVFYVEGCFGVVWAVFWLLLVHDNPEEHPRISDKERTYIKTEIAKDAHVSNKALPIPWKSILRSMPFYSILIANIGHNWGFLILLVDLPVYLKTVFGFDIKSNAVILALPYFLSWISTLILCPFADLCKKRKWLSTVAVRKIWTLIGHLGPALCLFVMAGAGCNIQLIIAMLMLSQVVEAGNYGGWLINHIDIAPTFSGTLFGITNGVSMLVSWLGPVVVGFMTDENQTLEAWSAVFIMAGGVLAADSIFFLIFGSGSEQSWNYKAEGENDEVENNPPIVTQENELP
ncbi:putative inorganic phosphate cotransporter [Artemia franciscana]|uniref:putative inorganic phosphate cotransporter n=1 Tax=Artemia franciscana TaxID=6661 RepID=UPI0032D9F007